MRVLIFQILLLLWVNQTYSQLKSPYWQMPIFIEDGNGDKDTVLIGFDTLAKFQYGEFDSLFEEYIRIDTNKFSVYSDGGKTIGGDLYGRKSMVTSNRTLARVDFTFINGIFPLTFQWSGDSLNNSKFPIPLTSPFVNKTKMWWTNNVLEIFPDQKPFCNNDGTYTITTDPSFSPSFYECHVLENDSLVVTSLDNNTYFPNNGGQGLIRFSFVPIKQKLTTGIEVPANKNYLNFYPNPALDYLTLVNNSRFYSTIKLINPLGSVIKEVSLQPKSKMVVSILLLDKGLYLLKFENNEHLSTHNLLIR